MGSDLADIPGIPDGVRVSFKKLLDEPVLSKEELAKQVDDYADLLSRAEGDWLDEELAGDLINVSRAYLNTVWEGATGDQQRLIQAALRYFVIDDDFGGDLTSSAGLDDDQLVMNAVARHLNRNDLIV